MNSHHALTVLKEARRLHCLGFSILWLHPRSKRPIGNGWTKGPRKTWDELKQTYQEGFNVGVRLGSASRIKERGMLAVIDVDIKSADKRHRVEAMNALKKLIGDASCPEVRSGRGNGSRHLYCLTKTPFKTWNPAGSSEMIKVLMPSKSPSKNEIAELSSDEIKQGWRMSRAWEISYYSDGRQVVLPPSIHPDTGKPYFWKETLIDDSSLPVLDLSNPSGESAEPKRDKPTNGVRLTADEAKASVFEFSIDEGLDVRWYPGISKPIRKLIIDGIWAGRKVEDRSAFLLTAATGLFSAGLDRNGVLTVLTDRSTFLGECAYEHAKTDSRRRAALWLWNYTVRKVEHERDAAAAFREVAVVEESPLEESVIASQAQTIEDESDWKQDLEKTAKGGIKPTLNNCKTVIQNSCEMKTVVGRDEFANQDYYLCDTPWRSKKGQAIVDMDIVRIKFFCSENFGVEFGDNIINQALLEIADVNRYHPVRKYLGALIWDGKPRIETWLKDFAGAEGPDEYLRAVSRKALVAMVKRVMEPGCKFDHVLILEGDQGAGKSTLLSKLAAPWFSDQPLNIGDKDAVLTMQSKWLIELGELASLNRGELESMKAFITQTTDRIRAPYGKRVEEYPRQSIFVGSTNLKEYLKDETGNRRFWPVRCFGDIDFDGVEAVRDQLFAEAVIFYKRKEPLYLETTELKLMALGEQSKRNEVDEWQPAIVEVLSNEVFPRLGFEMRQLAAKLDQFGAQRLDKSDQMRIAKLLRLEGYERYQETGGARRALWAPGEWVAKQRAKETKASKTREKMRTALDVYNDKRSKSQSRNTLGVSGNTFFGEVIPPKKVVKSDFY